MLAVLSIAVGLGGACLLLEVVTRMLPVGQGLRARPVTQADPVFQFEPHRDVTFSLGWRMAHAQRVHLNNAGFVSDVDYDSTLSTPLLALVGDSYVEAQIVPPAERLLAQLTRAAGEGPRVYGFAASGAPLSQYVVWAEHAKAVYGASGAIFVVVGNDFDESLASNGGFPGFHYFRDDNGRLALELVPFEPNPLRSAADYSSLARYLVFNLYAPQTLAALVDRLTRRASSTTSEGGEARQTMPDDSAGLPAFVGNTASAASPERLRSSERAVTAFLDEVAQRTGWPPDRVLLVVDGFRLYDAAETSAAPRSYFGRMRSYLMQSALARGHEVIDLEPIFSAAHARDGRRFEHEDDRHWNGVAHRLAAGAIARSKLFQSTTRGRLGS